MSKFAKIGQIFDQNFEILKMVFIIRYLRPVVVELYVFTFENFLVIH